MRQRAAASLLYQSKYAEAAFRNLLKLIFLKIVGRILAFYSKCVNRYKGDRHAIKFNCRDQLVPDQRLRSGGDNHR